MRFNPEGLKVPEKKDKVLPDDHWFKVAEKLYKESGEIPDPLQIRAAAIVEAFGIPSSQYSALEIDKEGKRIIIKREKDKEGKEKEITKDEIIAEYLTNKPGVLIEGETPSGEKIKTVSSDFRDLYLEGLPEKLKEVLDKRTLAIMETEYEHQKEIRENFGETKNFSKINLPIHYFRLPGGIDVIMQGYHHIEGWQKNHGQLLKEINKSAQIICIEGLVDKPYGKSLDLYWSVLPKYPAGHYDVLMKEAVDAGFNGLFTEIDARDVSLVDFDEGVKELPQVFFQKYFEYLKKECPTLTENIQSPEKLKEVLIKQSGIPLEGFVEKEKTIFHQGKIYRAFPYFSKEGKVSLDPTFLELGQHLFSDALSAVKLHLIGKLMPEGHIEKGPIIDYEGVDHLSSKSFFLREPQYAMEVVLRTVNELMAGKVKKEGNIPEIYKVFEKPNWQEIVKEIAKLAFKEVENAPSKPTAIGPNQRKLIDKPIDFLKTYNINPEKVIPTDEKIKEIREKFQKLNSDMRHPTERPTE